MIKVTDVVYIALRLVGLVCSILAFVIALGVL